MQDGRRVGAESTAPAPLALVSPRRLSAWLVVAAALALSATPSCDRGDPTPSKIDSPPLAVEATYPALGATDVPVDAPIRVRFNRFLRPDTAVRQSIRVTGGTIDKATGAAIAGEAFLEPTYDVVERVVTWRLPAGSAWAPGVLYTVTIWAARDREGFGVRAWDGQDLPSSVIIQFTPSATATLPTEVPVNGDFCGTCNLETEVFTPGVGDIVRSSCGFTGCHRSEGSVDTAARAGLDFSTPARIASSALRAPAHNTFSGTSSTDAPTNPYVFGVNMPIIDPGNPGNSMMLFKTLIRPDSYTRSSRSQVAATAALPVGGELRPADGEIARLRDGFVRGDLMPPANQTLGIDEVRMIQAWISAGAPLRDDCPKENACKKEPPAPDPCEATNTCARALIDYPTEVFPILGPTMQSDTSPSACGVAGCHSNAARPAESGVDWTQAYPQNLIGKVREKGGPEKIIVPRDPTQSFLYRKLQGNFEGLPCAAGGQDAEGKILYCGDQMPLIGSKLTSDQLETVRLWIAQGAHPNRAAAEADPANGP